MTGDIRQLPGSKKEHNAKNEGLDSARPGRLTMFKIVWLFALGCIAGFLMESVFSIFSKGYIESRRGMIYGPFNQVYGFGLVAMVLILHPFAGGKPLPLFLSGALIGGSFEFVCSWLQEKVIGTVSWDYTGNPGSIGGRTSLEFMFYWGVLAIVLMKFVYPALSSMIDRIPRDRFGKFITRALAGFLVVNMAVSLFAVTRWHQRVRGVAPANQIEEMLDEHYPDDRLAKIYPNMKVTR